LGAALRKKEREAGSSRGKASSNSQAYRAARALGARSSTKPSKRAVERRPVRLMPTSTQPSTSSAPAPYWKANTGSWLGIKATPFRSRSRPESPRQTRMPART